MQLEDLKKGLWGYKKELVLQYISELEGTFSQKLLEKDAQMDRAVHQAQERARGLEEKTAPCGRSWTSLRGRQDQIAKAIVDARASADALRAESQVQAEAERAETRAREEAARETIRQTLEAELAELERYRGEVAALREAIRGALEGIERQAEELERQVQALDEAAPTGNLTLFQ